MAKRFGFTLAEVLITLGIIGVVAAMTIPTLMNQTNQAEFKTGFKKVVSTLNQAISMNVALDNTDFSLLATGTSGESGSVFNMFTSRMNVIKTTTGADTGSAATAGNYSLYFNDGMTLSFPSTAASCVSTTLSSGCVAIVDVNGAKKPNRLSNCSNSAAATTDGGTCATTNLIVGDRFSVRFGDQQVAPNGSAARYIMYN